MTGIKPIEFLSKDLKLTGKQIYKLEINCYLENKEQKCLCRFPLK